MNVASLLDFGDIRTSKSPFHYFVSPAAFREATADRILSWFKSDAPWRLVETDFYEQYEFSLIDSHLPNRLSLLIDKPLVCHLKNLVAAQLCTKFHDEVEITAHRLTSGQSIRIHNDVIENGETHRLIVHINAGWAEQHGGLFVIFNTSDPLSICKLLKPLHNSAIGFAISENSNHAVSKVYDHTRFSLVYSFKVID